MFYAFWLLVNLACIAVNVIAYSGDDHAGHLYIALLNAFSAGIVIASWYAVRTVKKHS